MNDESLDPPLWTHRGYLPHFHGNSHPQFITYRLGDSLPKSVLEKTQRHIQIFPAAQQLRKKIQLLDKYLDQGFGCCILRDPNIAEQIIENWYHFDGVRYKLLDWVVMPNHVHLLINIYDGWRLGQILHSWKSYTANLINHYLQETGKSPLKPVWQREYWDRYARGENHARKIAEYILHNPVNAGFCNIPEQWPYSSAGAPSARRQQP